MHRRLIEGNHVSHKAGHYRWFSPRARTLHLPRAVPRTLLAARRRCGSCSTLVDDDALVVAPAASVGPTRRIRPLASFSAFGSYLVVASTIAPSILAP